jgi:predicted metal-dependent HD superfamily phosphohydrolase
LNSFYRELKIRESQINSVETIGYAIAWHDLVYDVKKQDNEEQSAAKTVLALTQMGIEQFHVNRCHAHIIATKTHFTSSDNDTNLFTDADLAILGTDSAMYQIYAQNIRTEYEICPDHLYKTGRKKVLNQFLEMGAIYKTSYFQNLYETKARLNLQEELISLA